MDRGYYDCNITPISALKSPTSTIVQTHIVVDDRVDIKIDDVIIKLCVSNFIMSIKDALQLGQFCMEVLVRRTYSEDSLSVKRGAVAGEMPRGILPAVSAEIVGAVDVTMTESFTFSADEVIINVIRVYTVSFRKFYMSHCWKSDKLALKPEEYTRVRSSIILAIDSFCHPILDIHNILSIA
ncbi:hypothetical protein K503DRAFT_845384 [Rhizopogon vinicolor AM-OR11-026]|uniref:Uncharacterized protein n=1 Tax=Rhizopogon vinicolor AM-OR11-026 TaxID=1314800 RepID=A0A1B7MHR4_9AGAM|nr:hypothetical protein K503DRAFT_845384 [Rhizopogon vinicolor AM-OR11-026]